MVLLRGVHAADGYPLRWPDDPRGWLSPPELMRAWVAVETDGTIAGHIAASRKDGDAEVGRLFVAPAARRRSVARDLVRTVRDWARPRGYALTLNVVDDGHRTAAIAFYESTGWRYTRTTVAGWTAPDGTEVRLRHYRAAE